MDLDCPRVGGWVGARPCKWKGRGLKEKVCREVCWIKLQYCLISSGKSCCPCACLCVLRKYTPLHFRLDCTLPGGGTRLPGKSVKRFHSPHLLQINLPQNQIRTRRDSWEWYKKNTKLKELWSKNAKSSETRERKQSLAFTLHFYSVVNNCAGFLGAFHLNPAQREGNVLITENNLREN